MSGYLAGKVWQSGLDGALKPLAACLADLGNDSGCGIYPSVEYLQWLLGWSESSVRRGMKALRASNILVAEQNLTGGRGLVPVYRMRVDSLPQRAPWSTVKKGVQTDTLFERVSNQSEKGVTGDAKGCQTDQRNKEEPLVNRERTVRMVHPTLEEIQKYCDERKNQVDPTRWFDYYSANGWRVGRNPMKDWRAAVRTWEKGNGNGNTGRSGSGSNRQTGAITDSRANLERYTSGADIVET